MTRRFLVVFSLSIFLTQCAQKYDLNSSDAASGLGDQGSSSAVDPEDPSAQVVVPADPNAQDPSTPEVVKDPESGQKYCLMHDSASADGVKRCASKSGSSSSSMAAKASSSTVAKASDAAADSNGKFAVCHRYGPKDANGKHMYFHRLLVGSAQAVQAHINHGDKVGDDCTASDDDESASDSSSSGKGAPAYEECDG